MEAKQAVEPLRALGDSWGEHRIRSVLAPPASQISPVGGGGRKVRPQEVMGVSQSVMCCRGRQVAKLDTRAVV